MRRKPTGPSDAGRSAGADRFVFGASPIWDLELGIWDLGFPKTKHSATAASGNGC